MKTFHSTATHRPSLLCRQTLAIAVLAAATSLVRAQGEPPDLLERSLPLRTALHHDPSLKAPLDQLLAMYRSGNHLDELVALYRDHVAQYPDDPHGRIVLLRLLAATNEPNLQRLAREAAEAFPREAFLEYLRYEARQRSGEPRAIESLDRAIELEKRPGRRTAWVDLLLGRAVESGRRDLALKNLRQLAESATDHSQRLEVARKMIRYKFHDEALGVLEEPMENQPAPETMVSLELEAARAEVALGKRDAAAARLDRLLGKLTADYWRRSEIVARRLALMQSRAERDNMIAAARKRALDHPKDEAAALDLAQVLAGLQHRREALQVLQEAGRRLPNSEAIERQTLQLFDRLSDERGKQQYLAERLESQPQRRDLALVRVKSLFLIGRRDQARKAWQDLIAELPEQQQADQYLEMARYLRRSQLLSDAAEAFRQALRYQPDRLDVRRELAETYAAMGNRQRMREALAESPADNASLEHILDLVQFMLAKQLFVEATLILEARRQQDQENLDVRILLLDMARRLGDKQHGVQLIEETRPLADTSAKYRRWFEAAAALHDEFETLVDFVRGELMRLDGEDEKWSETWLERRLALADVVGRGETLPDVVAMLETALADQPPAAVRDQLRRMLIKTIENDTQQIASLEEQLKQLAADQPSLASEASARLVLLYNKQQRHDLLAPLLLKIDVSQISDPALLAGLLAVYRSHYNNPTKTLEILRRLTQVNPTDRRNWEQWLLHLAAAHDENQLRVALRRLLAGVDKLEIGEETRQALEQRLVDSYWRGIGRLLAAGEEGDLSEALALIDSVGPLVTGDLEACWVAWVRAYVLTRLGRTEVVEEAIQLWEQLVQRMQHRAPADITPEQLARVALPDGISISLSHARKLLRSAGDLSGRSLPPPAGRSGPLPPYRVRWAMEAASAAAIAAVVPTDGHKTLVVDVIGTIYCLHADTGKLLWQQSGAAQTVGAGAQHRVYASNPFGGGGYSQTVRTGRSQAAAPIVFDDRFVVAGQNEVSCRSLQDGRLLWQTFVGNSTPSRSAATGQSLVTVLAYRGDVLTFEPRSATLVRINPATGKVVWDRQVSQQRGGMVSLFNSGARLQGDRLLFFGTRAGILDLASEKMIWSFEPWRVSGFPVQIAGNDAASSASGSTAFSSATPVPVSQGNPFGHGSAGSTYAPSRVHRTSHPSQAAQLAYLNYQQPTPQNISPNARIGLTNSAVIWAANGQRGGQRDACLTGQKLLLIDPSGLLLVNTHLPLAGRRISVSGQFVGLAGHTACWLSGNSLSLVDVAGGGTRNVSLQEIHDPNAPFWLDVAMDGPLAFVAGPRGILCVNVLSGQRVFKATLPEDGGSTPSDHTTAVAQRASTDPFGTSQARTTSRIGRVHGDVLYTLQSPTCLVAIERKQP